MRQDGLSWSANSCRRPTRAASCRGSRSTATAGASSATKTLGPGEAAAAHGTSGPGEITCEYYSILSPAVTRAPHLKVSCCNQWGGERRQRPALRARRRRWLSRARGVLCSPPRSLTVHVRIWTTIRRPPSVPTPTGTNMSVTGSLFALYWLITLSGEPGRLGNRGDGRRECYHIRRRRRRCSPPFSSTLPLLLLALHRWHHRPGRPGRTDQ